MRICKKALGVLASVLTLALLFAGVPAGGAVPQGFVQTGGLYSLCADRRRCSGVHCHYPSSGL